MTVKDSDSISKHIWKQLIEWRQHKNTIPCPQLTEPRKLKQVKIRNIRRSEPKISFESYSAQVLEKLMGVMKKYE